MLKRIPRRTHIILVLRELHWLKINNTALEYLSDLISFNDKSMTVRTVHVHPWIPVYYVLPQLINTV